MRVPENPDVLIIHESEAAENERLSTLDNHFRSVQAAVAPNMVWDDELGTYVDIRNFHDGSDDDDADSAPGRRPDAEDVMSDDDDPIPPPDSEDESYEIGGMFDPHRRTDVYPFFLRGDNDEYWTDDGEDYDEDVITFDRGDFRGIPPAVPFHVPRRAEVFTGYGSDGDSHVSSDGEDSDSSTLTVARAWLVKNKVLDNKKLSMERVLTHAHEMRDMKEKDYAIHVCNSDRSMIWAYWSMFNEKYWNEADPNDFPDTVLMDSRSEESDLSPDCCPLVPHMLCMALYFTLVEDDFRDMDWLLVPGMIGELLDMECDLSPGFLLMVLSLCSLLAARFDEKGTPSSMGSRVYERFERQFSTLTLKF